MKSSRQLLLDAYAHRELERPLLSFYELDYLVEEEKRSSDPFNIYADPSWHELLELTRREADRHLNVGCPALYDATGSPVDLLPGADVREEHTEVERGMEFHTTVRLPGGRELRSRRFRDFDIDTVWTLDPLIKTADDLSAWTDLPPSTRDARLREEECLAIERREAALGDCGIILFDTADALCQVAQLMEMGEFCVMALTEEELFLRALRKAEEYLEWRIEAVCRRFPGYLWRLVGPEYAAEPFLPPELFEKYVVPFDSRLVDLIHRYRGKVRMHSHGRLRNVLPMMLDCGIDALDPLEPPPQGDMEIGEIQAITRDRITLLGTLEITDLENMSRDDFRRFLKVHLARIPWRRNFILMPSASPYGRKLSLRTMENYHILVEELHRL